MQDDIRIDAMITGLDALKAGAESGPQTKRKRRRASGAAQAETARPASASEKNPDRTAEHSLDIEV
jgi:hypothetical protein